MSEPPLLEVVDLFKSYRLPRPGPFAPHPLRPALIGVGFCVFAGRSFGVVGESGSGKSTLGRIALALDRPDSGTVRLEGRPLFDVSHRELRALRAHMQMIFQDPYGSLDPRQRIGRIVAEPLAALGRAPRSRTPRAGGSLARGGGLARVGCEEISARVFRRTAPAHRDRPRADHPPEACRRRRAGLRSRRVGAGAGAESDERSAARRGRDVPLDQPRPRRRRAYLRDDCGDVSRTDRRDGPDRGVVRGAGASLYARARRGDAAARPGRARCRQLRQKPQRNQPSVVPTRRAAPPRGRVAARRRRRWRPSREGRAAPPVTFRWPERSIRGATGTPRRHSPRSSVR